MVDVFVNGVGGDGDGENNGYNAWDQDEYLDGGEGEVDEYIVGDGEMKKDINMEGLLKVNSLNFLEMKSLSLERCVDMHLYSRKRWSLSWERWWRGC